MKGSEPIRVLVVDDSLFMRGAVTKMLEQDGRFQVVGHASDGAMAIQKVSEHGPDVVTMDFNMPIMNGAEAVKRIMASHPVPVVMLSAHTTDGARETIEALSNGAVDFVTKPSGEVSPDISRVGPELTARLINAVKADVGKLVDAQQTKPTKLKGLTKPKGQPFGRRVVVVAISTGGPAALAHLLPEIPRRTNLAIVIVQHMPATFTTALAERLDSLSSIKVTEAREGDKLHEGVALLAPGGSHLEFAGDGSVRLTRAAPVNGCRPSADVTMCSAATVFGRNTVGLVMTGMGRDGAQGMAAIKQSGGRTLAQSKETCVIFGMPRASIDMGTVDDIVPLDELASKISDME